MNTQENLQEDFESSDDLFSGIISRYLPYWPLFVGLTIVSIVAAVIYIRYSTPVYETTSKILVKDEKKGLDESKILESLDMFGSKKIVENEIEVIKSVDLTSQVVRSLFLYAPITEDGRITNASAYLSSPVLVELEKPDELEEVKKVYFQYDFNTRLINMDTLDRPLNTWFQSNYGKMRFIPNPRYQEPKEVKPLFFSLIPVYSVADELLERLEVEPASKQSTIIYLRLKDHVYRRAENIIDTLVRAYDQAAINDKDVLAKNTLAFVNDRLHYVVRELDSVETKIQLFKNKNKIVDISEQGKLFLESVSKTDEEVSKTNVQLNVLQVVEQYILGVNDKGGIAPSTLGVNDPLLSQLLDKLYSAELEYQRLRKTTAENNPILLALAEQISLIKPRILENIRNQRLNLESGRSTISTDRDRYSLLLNTIPQKERELLQISRQQSIKNNIYTFLLQKREETALSIASTLPDSRLIDRAHSTIKPVSPKKIIVFTVALALGIFAGITFISIKEVFNRNILFRSDIEAMTTVPIVGEIGYDNSKSPIVIGEGKRNFIAEQFRQLRTSLTYLGINKNRKKILITSAVSGEGKSFITANLGISLALADKKVVMLELDLRKPKLSELFNVSREYGITNYFIDDVDMDKIIMESGVHPNLYIVPSGPIPPNPSELILNGRLGELLSRLESRFDYIIIDTAPVSPVTDAYLISPFCDATLYVLRHGVTPKAAVKKLNTNSRLGGLKNMAIVFNGVKSRGIGKYGAEYGYGNTNGNGYGYIEEEIRKNVKLKM